MNPWYALLTAFAGYLIGSISFARIMMALVAPQQEYQNISRPVPGTSDTFEADSVSATAIRIQLGTRFGCLTAILDAAKAALPMLALRAWQPEQPYDLIFGTTVVVGHIYTLYHGFTGGRGLSTVYGGLLVLDPIGVVATTAFSTVVGILAEQVLILRWAGVVLMIPWVWFRTHDPAKLLYVVAANILYWTAMIPELRQALRLQEEGKMPDSAEVADLLGMRSFWQVVRRYSIRSLLARSKKDGSAS